MRLVGDAHVWMFFDTAGLRWWYVEQVMPGGRASANEFARGRRRGQPRSG
jgi:hypothetical protein